MSQNPLKLFSEMKRLVFGREAFVIDSYFVFGVLFPISYPQLRNVFTTFGVTAAVSGTLMKMKDL